MWGAVASLLMMCAGYAVDVSLPGAKVALEADGPTHIARTDPKRMLGATAMKRRHLGKMGWSVINVTFLVGGREEGGGA